jgi:Lon protease-like protein
MIVFLKKKYLIKKMNITNLPKIVSIFPLSNFIMFPKTTIPLNIFEPRYIEMINDSMSSNKLIGMIQPLDQNNVNQEHINLHQVGCLGKIVSFKETEDNRYLIELKGLIRFQIMNEIKSEKKYREYEVDFKRFNHDLDDKKEKLKFSDLELIFKDLKKLFEKRGFIINWKELEKQSLDEIINALAMASPFSLEEKQVLLEAENLNIRKNKIAEILTTYTYDIFDNTTIQ